MFDCTGTRLTEKTEIFRDIPYLVSGRMAEKLEEKYHALYGQNIPPSSCYFVDPVFNILFEFEFIFFLKIFNLIL